MLSTSLLLLLVITCPRSINGFSSNKNTNNIAYRQGQKSDQLKIASALAKELMNPLGVQMDRFVVATDSSNKVVGWAQIKPLGQKATRDPSSYSSRPGSYDLEQDVDQQLLDEFENDDDIQVPVGLASLPWTKEYKAMEEALQRRANRREELRAQLEKEQDKEALQLWELSSVYVEAPYRSQGIGRELVRRVVKQRLQSDNAIRPTSIYLLTLATTVDWYRDNFAFEEVSGPDIPSSMAFEVTAGNIITTFIGAKLCCMRGTSKTQELCNV